LFFLQTSHTTPREAGSIFRQVGARLSVVHHADVNDASREALITDIRGAPIQALVWEGEMGRPGSFVE
jgi:ribonuclease BN (tRNA processing enzyme)